MQLDVRCNSVINIDIDCEEAFRILVKTLHMNCILDEDNKYFTYKNTNGDLCVYTTVDSHVLIYDDRGELYNALMEVAKCIFPNI